MSSRTIAVTITDRLSDNGETLYATLFSKHLGGKGANSAVAAFRTSHMKPNSINTAQTINDGLHKEVHGTNGMGDEFGPLFITRIGEPLRDKPRICVVIVESDFGENRILLTAGANLSLLPAVPLRRQAIDLAAADSAGDYGADTR